MDALGYLVRFRIPAAQAHDLQGVPGLPGGLEFGALVGDRASGADWLLDDLDGRGAEAAVPPERNRTAPRARDREMCGWRHLVDSFFPKPGEFRATATRYARTGMTHLAPDPPPEDAVARGPGDRGELCRSRLLRWPVFRIAPIPHRRAGRVPGIGGERPTHDRHGARAFAGRLRRSGGGDGLATEMTDQFGVPVTIDARKVDRQEISLRARVLKSLWMPGCRWVRQGRRWGLRRSLRGLRVPRIDRVAEQATGAPVRHVC